LTSDGVQEEVVIRPLRSQDVAAVEAMSWDALSVHVPAEVMPPDEDLRRARGRARIAHLLDTDPDGAWVAAQDGQPVGVALALMREEVWGLSLLAVAGGHQGAGIGRRLLAQALRYGEGARGGIILSSVDPRAMRSYARAGFALRPCVCATGHVDRSALPAGLRARAGDPVADRETCDAASRAVRGATHGADVQRMIELGGRLLVLDGRGFAVVRDSTVPLLAARDDEAARDLLWSALAAVQPGATAQVDFLTAEQGWAIDIVLRAGLALSPDGPVFVRGDVGPMRPYVPSGAYL
jgi:GNAT superfamily N-acetyltransferase